MYGYIGNGKWPSNPVNTGENDEIVGGTCVLAPEHLRLGTWDLLCAWSGAEGRTLDPRLGMHLVHEAAFCFNGVRASRSLSQKGFELANGLPFVPSDPVIHWFLGSHTVAEAQALQVALGKIRRASGHFPGRLLAIDPHRIQSSSKRQMRRHRFNAKERAQKMTQTFFCLDAESSQPLCFTLASAAKTVAQATPELLSLSQSILNPSGDHRPLVLADTEHYTAEIIDHARLHTPFDLLMPMPQHRGDDRALAGASFTPQWAGYATAKLPYRLQGSRCPEPCYRFIQRNGERADDYHYKSFLATADRDELQDLTVHYPQRWHLEEARGSAQHHRSIRFEPVSGDASTGVPVSLSFGKNAPCAHGAGAGALGNEICYAGTCHWSQSP